MARIAGRNGAMYVGLASAAATASLVPFLKEYTLDQASDRIDVTSFDDATKTYVPGLPDAKGTYSGFYDTATAQLYTAALGGFAAKTYLYPDKSTPTIYFFGTATFDMSLDVKVDGAVEVSGSWAAATPFSRIGL